MHIGLKNLKTTGTLGSLNMHANTGACIVCTSHASFLTLHDSTSSQNQLIVHLIFRLMLPYMTRTQSNKPPNIKILIGTTSTFHSIIQNGEKIKLQQYIFLDVNKMRL